MPCNSRSSMTRSLSPWWNHRKPWYFYDLSRELKPFLRIRSGGEGQMDKCWALSCLLLFRAVQLSQNPRRPNTQKRESPEMARLGIEALSGLYFNLRKL
jgi:hypothetical protein